MHNSGKKALLALNGVVNDFQALGKLLKMNSYDFVIAADGGAKILDKLNIIPNEVIGDLDSLDEDLIKNLKDEGVVFKKYKPEKDETDSELCILRSLELGVEEIDFIGALGGRIDHEISNLGLLYYSKERSLGGRIIGEKEIITLVKDEIFELKNMKDKTISIIAFAGSIESISLKGFKYELENHYMEFGKPRGMSNIVIKDKATISLKNGAALVIINLL